MLATSQSLKVAHEEKFSSPFGFLQMCYSCHDREDNTNGHWEARGTRTQQIKAVILFKLISACLIHDGCIYLFFNVFLPQLL